MMRAERAKVLELLHILIFIKIFLLTVSMIITLMTLRDSKKSQLDYFDYHTFHRYLVYAGLVSTGEGLVNTLTILGVGLRCRPLLLPYMAVALLTCLYCVFYLFEMVFFLRIYELGLITAITALLLASMVFHSLLSTFLLMATSQPAETTVSLIHERPPDYHML